VIYLDHNASNPPDRRLTEVYAAALADGWANPSSPHGPGRRARARVEEARERTAALVGVAPGQVTFTASGTEGLNQALESAVRAAAGPARVVASAVEHPAVLEPLEAWAAEGRVELVRAPVDAAGRVDPAALPLDPAPVLVALIAAQNEVGTVEPAAEVGARCAAAGVPLLLDATQAVGRLALPWSELPWSYLVMSAHKMRAPRGAAALVHRDVPAPAPIVYGGPQELGRRAGTEPVAAIAALGAACELVARGELLDAGALRARREAFEAELAERVPGLEVLARAAERLPQTTAVLVPGGDSEALLVGLDLAGVAASSGSACSSGALRPSHVLAAMGVDPDRARGRLRFSFGPETTAAELTRAAELLADLARA